MTDLDAALADLDAARQLSTELDRVRSEIDAYARVACRFLLDGEVDLAQQMARKVALLDAERAAGSARLRDLIVSHPPGASPCTS